MGIWEALAVLVATKLWLPVITEAKSVAVKLDNLGVSMALDKQRSHGVHVSRILKELALIESKVGGGVSVFNSIVHIPGVTNVLPDALSRLKAPPPHTKPFPQSLLGVPAPQVPIRDSAYWTV